ncbi:MAG: hypothetical protein HYX51_04200 [Chloroflexi bacterium]|nr:hypothetical protein [Chloroflexota bacterium]
MASTSKRKDVAGTVYHPRSPKASVEYLRQFAGIIALSGPVPSTKFLGDADEDGQGDGKSCERDRASI